MLETLFARAGQERVFLLLTACGLALGALAQGTEWLRRRFRRAALFWDGLLVATALALVLLALLTGGEGLRAYALLGLIIGLLLYYAGVHTLLTALCARVRRRGAGHEKAS